MPSAHGSLACRSVRSAATSSAGSIGNGISEDAGSITGICPPLWSRPAAVLWERPLRDRGLPSIRLPLVEVRTSRVAPSQDAEEVEVAPTGLRRPGHGIPDALLLSAPVPALNDPGGGLLSWKGQLFVRGQVDIGRSQSGASDLLEPVRSRVRRSVPFSQSPSSQSLPWSSLLRGPESP